MVSSFEIWTGIPLCWDVDPVRSLSKGNVWRYRVSFGYGWGQERVWGGLGDPLLKFLLVCMGVGIGFGIWAGIPLF